MNYRRYAVIMAGGSGERFWPVSTVERPKQLLKLASPDSSLLRDAVTRLSGLMPLDQIIIATAPHLVEPIRVEMPDLPAENVIAEPHKRDTAGCLVWIAAHLLVRHPDARENVSLAIVAADHLISPAEAFVTDLGTAMTVAETRGGLGTIGIRPTRPETGYGYIECNTDAMAIVAEPTIVRQVRRFKEKPDAETAAQYLASGHFLWNSGMFFWTLDTFMLELERAKPDLASAIPALTSLIRAQDDIGAANRFAELPKISIDYALMESATNVFVAEATFDWDDIGAWDALSRSLAIDDFGNVLRGPVTLLDSERSVVFNESDGVRVCLLGVHDLVVVATNDAVLVCPKDRAQDVKKLVEQMKK